MSEHERKLRIAQGGFDFTQDRDRTKSWTCHGRCASPASARRKPSDAAAGSPIPNVSRFNRMPRIPFLWSASRSASVAISPMTATSPRARPPRCSIASSAQRLSVPYTLGCTMTPRPMPNVRWIDSQSSTDDCGGVYVRPLQTGNRAGPPKMCVWQSHAPAGTANAACAARPPGPQRGRGSAKEHLSPGHGHAQIISQPRGAAGIREPRSRGPAQVSGGVGGGAPTARQPYAPALRQLVLARKELRQPTKLDPLAVVFRYDELKPPVGIQAGFARHASAPRKKYSTPQFSLSSAFSILLRRDANQEIGKSGNQGNQGIGNRKKDRRANALADPDLRGQWSSITGASSR